MNTNKCYFTHASDEDGRRFTLAGVLNESRTQVKFGIAICSEKDQFARKKGRDISTGRATKKPIRVIDINFSENGSKAIVNELIKLRDEVAVGVEDFYPKQ